MIVGWEERNLEDCIDFCRKRFKAKLEPGLVGKICPCKLTFLSLS